MNSAVRRAAVLLGAGALVASASALVTPAAHAAGTGSGQYNCTSTLKGSTIPVGTWTAAVAAFSPSSVAKGATISTPWSPGSSALRRRPPRCCSPRESPSFRGRPP
ncbi:hypothetical protein [Branchiibius cervicis]|uniref:Uncharacterized protein n=1 Tax=Branchiibius cervicis TaxID=908252 RepID=A0ABW2AW97_9MICO